MANSISRFIKASAFYLTFFGFYNVAAQDNVGIGTTTPDASAILDVSSIDKGMLPPRMSTLQRDAINNAATGLVIFNTTDSALQIFNGVCWLNSYQENCDDCFFDATLSNGSGTIDRVISNSITEQINIDQTAGLPQDIALTVAGNLPQDLVVDFSANPQFSTGTVDVSFTVTPFTPDGTYVIVIELLCGNSVNNLIYTLEILECYILSVNNSLTNYDLSTDLYITYPLAPTNQPVCVVCTVGNGVSVTGATTADPAFNTGGLPAGSLVAIINNGNIIGKGGDGGQATDPVSNPPLTGEGFDGGDAINLTVDAEIQNNLYIFGGGGGGSAMAFTMNETLQIPPPIGGNISFGIFQGAGGGGGAGGGEGGQQPGGVIGISFYSAGADGTTDILGLGGDGGILNFPIPITIGPVEIQLNPNAFGGDGGDYGFPGQQGSFALTMSAIAIINIPFIGDIPIPIINNLSVPIPFPPPPPGQPGFAVRRNGFNTNIPDNIYQTSFLRGEVGN